MPPGKPKLRGWLHLALAPLTLAAGIVLVALSPDRVTRMGSTVFMASSLLLFTVSAVYHRGTWSPRTWEVLRRFDHANIFVLIAGTYTPFALVLLSSPAREWLLWCIWGAAVAGVVTRVTWRSAPRWLYVPIYMAMGWAAVFFLPALARGANDLLGFSTAVAVIVLMVAGGLLYTFGGAVYGFRRPDPFPTWFGFHEVFHSFTVLAFTAHYVAVSLVVYSLR